MVKLFVFILGLVAIAYIAAITVHVTPPNPSFGTKSLSLNHRSIDLSSGGQLSLKDELPYLDIDSVKITEEKAHLIHFEITYDYQPPEQLGAQYLAGKVLLQGGIDGQFGFRPAALRKGKHTALVELVLLDSATMDRLHSHAIEVYVYNSGGSPIFRQIYNFEKQWCKSKINILDAYWYCARASKAANTAIFVTPMQLKFHSTKPDGTPAKRSAQAFQSSNTDLQPRNAISANADSLEEFNGHFDNGLQGWKIEQGVEFVPNGGRDNSGAIKMAAAPYIPKNQNSWREAQASYCLPAERLSWLTIEAAIKLSEIPQNSSAHSMGLTWYTSDDCTSGGQHGGYAYIDFKLGWQTLKLEKRKASLGAKSFKITLIQNQTWGQRSGIDNDTFRAMKQNSSATEPGLVSAIWDEIKIIYKLSTDSTTTKTYKKTQSSKTNLLLNPSFEKTTASWRGVSKDAWRSFAGGRSTVIETTLKSNGGSRGSGAFSQCVNLDPDHGIAFAAGIDYQNVPTFTMGGGRLRVTWYSDLNCKGKYQTSHHHDDIAKNAIGWSSMHIPSLKRPPNSQSASFQLIHSISGVGERRIWWDNAYFHATE